MTEPETAPARLSSIEEMQQEWEDLKSRVAQLEAERDSLEKENKSLHSLLEKVIEHRQRSHGELVLLLTSLVSKLPIGDVGVVVSKLVEHNTHVSEVCAALAKGAPDIELPRPLLLKALGQVKRDLVEKLKNAVEELIRQGTPLEPETLRSLVQDPELFFSPAMVRANRCFIKGQLPRERVLREFGEGALACFNDVTTDPRRNPRPKPEEIALAFKDGFEAGLKENTALSPDKQKELIELHRKVQQSKARTKEARAQREAFSKMSFLLELLHYYEHQNTESPELTFAQRLPTLVEQMAVPESGNRLEEPLLSQAEELLGLVLNPDYRLMVVNNIGKGGGTARTLKYVLRLRADKVPDQNEVVPEFVRHLIPRPPQQPPPAQTLAAILRLIKPDMQKLAVRGIMNSERLSKEIAESLGKEIGKDLGFSAQEVSSKPAEVVPAEIERQMAWERIKDLLTSHTDPIAVAAAFRDRLHAKYDAAELKQSWITLTEADPISLIRVFCHLPYLQDGRTDSIARTMLESYISRLTHQKYAATYHKVMNSLRNMFKANPSSPTLVNFMSLVRWVDAEVANRLSNDIGMPVAA